MASPALNSNSQPGWEFARSSRGGLARDGGYSLTSMPSRMDGIAAMHARQSTSPGWAVAT